MMKSYKTHIFYPDGRVPESGTQDISALSAKWLRVCAELLNHYGPVMDHNMGSTLSHFTIRMGGPIGELLIHGMTCFKFAISIGTGSEQDRATVNHFMDSFSRLCEACKATPEDKAVALIGQAADHTTCLFLDLCNPKIDPDQKGAMFQLGNHMAGAYIQYCGSQTKKTN